MKRHLSALLAALLLLTALLPGAAAFSDVGYGHWARSYISQASSQGWISGTGGDRYEPDRTVTAAEFFTMIANAFFPQELAAQPEGGVWYAPAWSLAQSMGLHEGTAVQSEDRLTLPLSRQDMAQVICGVLSAKGLPLPEEGGQTFADWADVSEGCRSAVTAASALGILNGKENGRFAPLDSMTRGEAAAVLCRIDSALYPMEVIRLVNEERAKEGKGPLTADPVLMEAAQIRTAEIKELFSHTRPNGDSCFSVLEEVGASPYSYSSAGENIAMGYSTPEAVMNGWMNSPGHRSNILMDGFTLIGVGYAGGRWVQLFGRK